VAKRGMGAAAPQAGFTAVHEVEPWEQVQVGLVRVTAVQPGGLSSCARP
jgi:hypothetical protein